MTHDARIASLTTMLESAKQLAGEDDPVLDKAMPRIAAILHDTLRLVDLEYDGRVLAYE